MLNSRVPWPAVPVRDLKPGHLAIYVAFCVRSFMRNDIVVYDDYDDAVDYNAIWICRCVSM